MRISPSIATSNPPYHLRPFPDPILHSHPRIPLPISTPTGQISISNRHQHLSNPQAVNGSDFLSEIERVMEEEEYRKARSETQKKGQEIQGFSVEGISVGGLETCVIIPEFKSAFDIIRFPAHVVHQSFVFITHGQCRGGRMVWEEV